MDIAALLRVVLRRWKIVVVVLLVTVVAAFLILTRVEPEYKAEATVLLSGSGQESPSTADDENAEDEETSGPRPVSAQVIAEIVRGGQIREDLDVNVPYTVEVVGDGSILRVTATSPSQDDEIADTVAKVTDEIQAQVEQRQEGISPAAQVQAQILAVSSEAQQETVNDPVDGTATTVYSASGSVLLSTPNPETANPYGPNAYTSRVLQAKMLSPEVAGTLRDQGANAEYAVGFESRDAAPLIQLEVTGASSEEVIQTLDSVIELMRDELEERQASAGVGAESRTVIDEIAVPNVAALSSSNLLRPLVAVAGLGFVAALALAFFTESMAQVWGRRMRQQRGRRRASDERDDEPNSDLSDDSDDLDDYDVDESGEPVDDLETERIMDEYSSHRR